MSSQSRSSCSSGADGWFGCSLWTRACDIPFYVHKVAIPCSASSAAADSAAVSRQLLCCSVLQRAQQLQARCLDAAALAGHMLLLCFSCNQPLVLTAALLLCWANAGHCVRCCALLCVLVRPCLLPVSASALPPAVFGPALALVRQPLPRHHLPAINLSPAIIASSPKM